MIGKNKFPKNKKSLTLVECIQLNELPKSNKTPGNSTKSVIEQFYSKFPKTTSRVSQFNYDSMMSKPFKDFKQVSWDMTGSEYRELIKEKIK